MSDEAKSQLPPVVFISYSHDSKEHKDWVVNLATQLRSKKRIDVRMDEWDLGAGDDVPKFMERQVAEADRVLMVCTEQYVRKADAGEGGVGYEAVVVTSELVKNLGTAKFIPVIRQSSSPKLRPKSVETRKYVDFSEDNNFEMKLDELAIELHNARKLTKPPIGGGLTMGLHITEKTPNAAATEKFKDAKEVHQIALSVAKYGDLSAWRQLTHDVKQPLSDLLNQWRNKNYQVSSMQIADLQKMVLEAATIYSPLMAVALAGVESLNPKFSNQQAMLDEFMRPRNWNASGLTVVTNIPDALVYIFQGVHGALCMEIGELTTGIALSRARIAKMHHFNAAVLHQEREFVGWPESFNHNCVEAWRFLLQMAEMWPWLNDIFHSSESFKIALIAYYMALNIQELAVTLSEGNQKALDTDDLRLVVPVVWMGENLEIQQKAYRLLIHSSDQLRDLWRSLGVSDKDMASSWPKWMGLTVNFSSKVNQHRIFSIHGNPVCSTLFQDVRPKLD